jgi:hypothetical protein
MSDERRPELEPDAPEPTNGDEPSPQTSGADQTSQAEGGEEDDA